MPVGYRQGNGYGYHHISPYPAIILILIVLQWFRVGAKGEEEGECNDLLSNGGLFIITLFLLVYCSCVSELANAIRYSYYYTYARPRRSLFGRWLFGRRFY